MLHGRGRRARVVSMLMSTRQRRQPRQYSCACHLRRAESSLPAPPRGRMHCVHRPRTEAVGHAPCEHCTHRCVHCVSTGRAVSHTDASVSTTARSGARLEAGVGTPCEHCALPIAYPARRVHSSTRHAHSPPAVRALSILPRKLCTPVCHGTPHLHIFPHLHISLCAYPKRHTRPHERTIKVL